MISSKIIVSLICRNDSHQRSRPRENHNNGSFTLKIRRKKRAYFATEVRNPLEKHAARRIGWRPMFSQEKKDFACRKSIRTQYVVRLPNAPSERVRISSFDNYTFTLENSGEITSGFRRRSSKSTQRSFADLNRSNTDFCRRKPFFVRRGKLTAS